MKNTKIKFRPFTICEWKKEEEFLRKHHKAGWKMTRTNLIGCYFFEKCQPEDVIYQLDYNSDSMLDKAEYIQMFSDCGWEYLQDLFGYSYFRKPLSEMDGKEEEIFCDDASRLEMIQRVYTGRMRPLIIIFFLCLLPNIFMQFHNDTPAGHFLLGLNCVLFVFYITMFLWFGIEYWKCWKSTQH